jgi:hypothetical protein
VLLGERDDLVGALDRVLGSGYQWRPDLLGDVAGLHLVAEVLDGLRSGTDPDQPGVQDGLGEVGVLGEEAVAGMDAVGAGLGGDRDDLLDREVRVAGRRALQRVGLVGQADEKGVPIGLGVDGDAADAGVLAGPDDAHGDLAAVGDQDLLKGRAHVLLSSCRQASRV